MFVVRVQDDGNRCDRNTCYSATKHSSLLPKGSVTLSTTLEEDWVKIMSLNCSLDGHISYTYIYIYTL